MGPRLQRRDFIRRSGPSQAYRTGAAAPPGTCRIPVVLPRLRLSRDILGLHRAVPLPVKGAVGAGWIVLSIFLLLLFPAFLLKYQSPALFMRKLPVVIVHVMLVVIALLTVCTPSQPDSAGYHLWLGSERYEEALLKLRQEYDDASRFRDQAVGFFSGLLEERERPDPTGGS